MTLTSTEQDSAFSAGAEATSCPRTMFLNAVGLDLFGVNPFTRMALSDSHYNS